jgi:gliding motility-associated-like protein
MRKHFLLNVLLILFLFGTCVSEVSAQCIAAFPYHEDFESGANGWFSGGTNNDWALGTPAKPVITGAAQGANCWITGGLTASFYNFSERSWVQSPCFDFSGLAHPYIHFMIFWEIEHQFDGGNLQYTLNGGTTWINVGAVNDPISCFSANWYNYTPITNLTTLATVRDGWSGNVQPTAGSCQGGSGSAGWVEAKHCMPYLAGKPSVIFRFTFGAGTTCNSYDGLAFDDIYIEEAPPIDAEFTYLCTGPKTYTFTDQSTNCPSTWAWNFGDPASGASNTSTSMNPAHVFSGPGSYTVSMTVNSTCSGPTTITYVIQVNAVTASPTPVSCHNGNDGTATAVVNPGNGNPDFTWSTVPPQNSQTATGLSPGTYTVTVTEPGFCPITASVTITQPPTLNASASSTPAPCGNPAGTASASGSGGVGPYTFDWSNGMSGTPITGLIPGPYIVTVTDQNGCTKTASVTVAISPGVSASINSHTNVSCNNGSNGTATVTATGGTMPYTYDWLPSGGSGPVATGLSAGTYTVTVTDANNCTATASVNITEPNPLQHNTSTNPSSCGASNGSATIMESGGVPGYTYAWAPSGGPGATSNNLAPGTYTVTVTDSKGCTDTAEMDVTISSSVVATITGSSNPGCFGGTNGSATVVGSNGSLPYTYAWSPSGGTNATATGLSAGTYTVTVTDHNNCTDSATITIGQPAALHHTVQITGSSCGMNNGAATITETGGTTPYSYNWSPSGGNANSAQNLAAGNYVVSITDLHGCPDTVHIAIGNFPPVSASIASSTPPSCFGGNNGSATVTTGGGTVPFTYAWAPSGGSGSTASGLTAGTYTVTVTDSKMCTATASVTLSQPTALSASTSSTPAPCNQPSGTASAMGSGGTGPYTYNWSNSSTGNTITNLPAGPYTVTVSDQHGCTKSASVTVGNTPGVSASISAHTNVNCNGESNGAATVLAAGGTTPYTYNWLPSGGTGATATGLSAGTYTVTVTDANNCTATASVNVTEPSPLQHTTSTTPSSCGASSGSATVNESGGTPGYSYAWLPSGGSAATAPNLAPGTYTVTVTDAHGCTDTAEMNVVSAGGVNAAISASSNVSCFGGTNGSATVTGSNGTLPYTYAWSPAGGTGSTATGLAAGPYQVTVQDANQCVSIASVTITQPTALSHSVTLSNVSCGSSNGAATIIESGGTPGYTYNWSPSGSGNSASNLPPANYVVSINDQNGCMDTIHFTISSIQPVQASIQSSIQVTCFGGTNGSATVTTTFGSAPYTYAWAPSGGTGSTSNSLPAGIYTVTVTDGSQCTATASVTITQPVILAHTVSITPANCGIAAGSATVQESGGTGSYAYIWSPAGGTGNTASSLTPGNYLLSVTDQNNCQDTVQVTIIGTSAVTAAVSSSVNVSCFGGNNGSITVTASGGTAPFSYQWSPAGPNTPGITGLTAGSYQVTVTDAHLCTASASATITEPAALHHTTTSMSTACGANNGTASITETGGIAPYAYQWSPTGGANGSASGLASGAYVVSVTDANNCLDTIHISIGSVGGVQATIAAKSQVKCFGGSDGSITISASSGTLPYAYAWSAPGNNGPIASGLAAGTYTVTVTDANNCNAIITTAISQPAVLKHQVTASSTTCGNNNGSSTITENGGTGPYTYSWSPSGGPGNASSNLAAGNYVVTVSDQNACTDTVHFNIAAIPKVQAVLASSSNVSCFGGSNGAAAVSTTAGTSPFSFAWLPSGGSGPGATGLSAGTYTVTVTDAHQCTVTVSATITQPLALNHTTSVQNASCNHPNVSATITETGGTSPFSYVWSPSGGNGKTANNLAGGNYIVSVTDQHGCVDTVHVSIANSPGITATLTSNNVSCFGGNNGSATVSVSVGTAPYTYAWTPSGGTGATANGLTAGIYTVSITDSQQCTTTVTATIGQPIAALQASVNNSNNVSCFGGNNGSVSVSGIGGTTPYTYSWAPAGGNGPDATGLSAGIYTVTVSDAHQCTVTTSAGITQPTALVHTASGQTATCNQANGSALVNETGGTAPYTYHWTPTGGSLSSAQNLAGGNYIVSVSDQHGCTDTVHITIGTTPGVQATIGNTTNVACFGGNNGSISVSVSTGAAPFVYGWSAPGVSGANPTGLQAGAYSVTITDAHQCTATLTTALSQPAALLHTHTVKPASCFGNDGSATVSETGGTTPYAYSWSPAGGNGSTASGLSPGNYVISISDGHGCTDTLHLSIGSTAAVQSKITSAMNVSCFGYDDGSISVNATGGTPPYTYAWTPSVSTTSSASGLVAGAFSIKITDASGCTSQTDTVIKSPPPLVTRVVTKPAKCHGDANGLIQVDTTFGGQPPYLYGLDPGALGSNILFSPLQAGIYHLLIQDANGCKTVDTVQVKEPAAQSVYLATDTIIHLGDFVNLIPQLTDPGSIVHIQWSPSTGVACDTCLHTQVQPLTTTKYQVQFTDSSGCKIYASELIQVQAGSIYVPNVFAPDSDGLNDHFNVYSGAGVSEIVIMQIYDRWGDMVFENGHFLPNDPHLGWDGKERGTKAPEAVYVYVITVKLADNSILVLSGDVTLVR